MKKLIIVSIVFILIVFAGSFSANAQSDFQLKEDVSYTFGYGEEPSYLIGALTAADTIGATDSVWVYSVRKKSGHRLQWLMSVALDSTGGTFDTTYVELWTKSDYLAPYTKRTTVIWYLGADTNITIQDANFRLDSEFARLRIWAEDDAFKAKIDSVFIKPAEE